MIFLTAILSYSNLLSNTQRKLLVPANDQSIIGEIIWGVVASLVFQLLLLGYMRWLHPQLERWKYNGVDLSGIWSEKYEPIYTDEKEESGKQEQDLTFKIKHAGNTITGTAELRDNLFSRESLGDRDFRIVSGRIKNGYVSLMLEINTEKKIGAILYLLKIQAEGDSLKGLSIYYSPGNERISPSKSVLKRKRIN